MPTFGTWKGSGIEGGGAVNTIAVNPTNPNTILGGGDIFGIGLSTDAGQTWVGKQKAARSRAELQVASVAWHPDGVQAFAAVGSSTGSGGLFYSADRGVSWKAVSSGFTMAGNQQGTHGLLPSNHPRNVGKLIAVDGVNSFVYIATWDRGIVRFAIQPNSTTWGNGTSIGLTGEYVRCLILDDATPTTLYASTFLATVGTNTGKVRRLTNANAAATITQMNSPVNVEEMVCLDGDLFACAMLHPQQNGGVDDQTKRGVFRCPGKSTTAAWTHITGPDYATVAGGSASGTPSWKGIDGYVSGGVTTLYATTVAGYTAEYGDTAEGPRNGSGVYQSVWKGTSSTGFASDNGTWTGLPASGYPTDVSNTLVGPPDHEWWHGAENHGEILGGKSAGNHNTVVARSNGLVMLAAWASVDGGANWRPSLGRWGMTTMRTLAVHPTIVGAAMAMNTDYKVFGTGETVGPFAGSFLAPGAADHLSTPSVAGQTTGYLGVWDEVTGAFYLSVGNRDQYTQGAIYYNPAPLLVDSSGNPTGANAWTAVTHPAGTGQIINGLQIITRANGVRRLIAFVKPSTAGGTDGGAYYRDMAGGVLTGSWTAAVTPSPLLDTQNTTLVPISWLPGKPLVIYDRNSGVYKSSDDGATYTRVLADTADIDSSGYAHWIPGTDSILVSNDTGVYRINNVSTTPTAAVSVGSPNMKHPGDITVTQAGNIYCLQRSDPDGTLASCWVTTTTLLADTSLSAAAKWTEIGGGPDFSSGYPTDIAVDEGTLKDGTQDFLYVSSRGGGVITNAQIVSGGGGGAGGGGGGGSGGGVTSGVGSGDFLALTSEKGRIRILLTTVAPGTLGTVTCTHPSGEQRIVRNMKLARMSGGVLLGYDYEAPIGLDLVYQAQVFSATDTTTPLDTSDSVTIRWDTDSEWVKDPLNPAANMPIRVAGFDDATFDTPTGILPVLGRPDPVAIGDVRQAESNTLNLLTLTKDESDRLHFILASGRALLFQSTQDSDYGNLYFQPLQTKLVRPSLLRDEPTRTWQITFQEVRIPGGDAAPTETWQDVAAQYATWQDLADQFGTWLDFAANFSNTNAAPTLTWRGA